MFPPTKTELAMEKMLEAEAELQAYARSGAYSPERQRKLAKSVTVARDEFIDLLTDLWPSI